MLSFKVNFNVFSLIVDSFHQPSPNMHLSSGRGRTSDLATVGVEGSQYGQFFHSPG